MSQDRTSPEASSTKRALRALQEMQVRLAELEGQARDPIAIVGMACRFPGARHLDAFWEMLKEGRDGITEVPPDRWDINSLYHPDSSVPGTVMTRWGGFLDELDQFDAQFFGISPREAPHVDPRQRLMLEIVWEALEDAGIPPENLAGTDTGVFLGVLTNDYDQLVSQDLTRFQVYTGIGTANSIVANRISYFLDLHGPSFVIDTACSGSLLATDLACRSLRSGQTSLAIAGGVAVNLQPNGEIFFSRAGSLSKEGKCRTFDSSANGMIRSEGAGVVVLKQLSRAIADGDRVYAVIKGSAVNHDGRSNGIMSPNGLAQEAMLRMAYQQAGVSPGKVQYIEAHGTATRVGDPVEVKALTSVLSEDRADGFACALGSVKTNIGHCESAAGVAGLIRVALSLSHRVIPPHLHLKELNPLIPEASFPLRIYSQSGPWPAENEPLIAGVSSFSFGGANVHVVLGEAPVVEVASETRRDTRPRVLPLSARSPEALRALAERFHARFSDSSQAASVNDICFSAGTRRSHHECRMAIVGEDAGDFRHALSTWLGGEDSPAVITGRRTKSSESRVVFVFSGQGSQWLGMGRELYASESSFREVIDRCDDLMRDEAGWSLLTELNASPAESRLAEIDVAQPVIFAFQVALAALWRSRGVVPQAVVGQSLGEVAAAHVSGALSLEDAVKVVVCRSRLLKTTTGRGRTAVVGLSLSQTQIAISGLNHGLSVAGTSGPTSSVVSGDPQSIGLLLGELQAKDVFCKLLENVDAAAHSPQMDPLRGQLSDALRDISPQPSTFPFVSTVTASVVDGTELGAEYWGRNLREPFLFANAIEHLIESGHNSFLEISSHPVLTGAIKQNLAHHDHEGDAIGTLARNEPERECFAKAIAALYVNGLEVDWRLQSEDDARFVKLPTYAWQRERYWYDQLPSTGLKRNFSRTKEGHALLGHRLKSAFSPGQTYWENEIGSASPHYLSDHRIGELAVLPGAAFLEMALSAMREISTASAVLGIDEAHFERLLILPDDDQRRIQTVLSPIDGGRFEFRIFSTRVAVDVDSDAEAWILHARGIVRSHAGRTPVPQKSLPEIQQRVSDAVDGSTHYDAMAARGLNYRRAFRCVEKIWRGERRAVGLINFPHEFGSELKGYEIHPTLLDAGFQIVSATLPPSRGDTYLPSSVKGLTVYGGLPESVWCQVELVGDSAAGAVELEARIAFFSSSGELLAEVEQLGLKQLEAVNGSESSEPRDSLYEVRWIPMPSPEVVRQSPSGRFLILADRGGIGEVLSAELGCLKHESRVVFSESRSGLEEIVKDAALSEGTPLLGVIHLWGLDAGELQGVESLDRANELGPLSILATLRGLIASGNAKTKLWCVTQNGQRPGEGPIEVLQSGLWGMGRALAVEHPELWGGLIDIDGGESQQERAARIISELTSSDDEREVAWRDGVRLVPRLARWEGRRGEGIPVQCRPVQCRPVQCRPDGSYLVTGGLSGLGLEAAKWLIEQGARRVIVAGRRGVPARTEWQRQAEGSEGWERVESLKELERMGAAIEYWSVDVSNEREMRQLWEREEAEGRPAIRGIVHAAGVLDDGLAMRMSDESCLRVQEGKVKGALVLDELSRGRGLDFYIAYSSVSGVMGQVGQANYGAANAYLDGLMAKRRERGEAGLSIAWGPWTDVGLFARYDRAARADFPGVRAMTLREGKEILSLASSSGSAQIVAINVDWSAAERTRLTSLLGKHAPEDGDVASVMEPETFLLDVLLAEGAERRSLLESYLREMVARVLKFDPERLNVRKPLTALGLDSIMAVEMKNSIQATLNVSLSMVDFFTGSVADLVAKLESQLAGDGNLAELLREVEMLPEARTDTSN